MLTHSAHSRAVLGQHSRLLWAPDSKSSARKEPRGSKVKGLVAPAGPRKDQRPMNCGPGATGLCGPRGRVPGPPRIHRCLQSTKGSEVPVAGLAWLPRSHRCFRVHQGWRSGDQKFQRAG